MVDLIISFPLVRMRLTRQARPMHASQAPNVSIIIIRGASEGLFFLRSRGRERIRVRIMVSRARRDISRCFRWIDIVSREDIDAKDRKVMGVRDIARRRGAILRFTRPMLFLSYLSSRDKIN